MSEELERRLLSYSSMNDHLSWRSKCEREAAEALKRYREALEDCLLVFDGDAEGPAQVRGVIRQARQALAPKP